MNDLRVEIKGAFEREQVAFPPAGELRAQIVEALSTRSRRAAKPRPAQDLHWLVLAATVLVTIAIVAGLLAIRFATIPPANVRPGPPPERCVPGPTPQSDRFARVHGCITYREGDQIKAVDPAHPANQISLGPANGLHPVAWSRDGRRLLLTEVTSSPFEGVASDLYVMNSDGSQTRLTHDGRAFGGSFSPDGERIAFEIFDRGIFVVDANGGTPRMLAESHLAWWLESPAWSPDGSTIAYAVYREGPDPLTYEIWVMSADGTRQRMLVDLGECEGGGCSGGLAWSPDGSLLAFHSARGHVVYPATELPKGQIYTVRADGSGLRQLTNVVDKEALSPAWSPDGSRIGFVRFGSLFTMAQDGSDVRRVEGVFVAPAGLSGAWAWNPAD